MGNTHAISVEARASIYAPADIGFVDLYARTDGMLLEDAIAQSRRQTDGIVEAIRNGIPESAIKNVTVTMVFAGESNRLGALQKGSKPEVIQNLLVTISPSAEIGVKIVDLAIRAGASLQTPLSAFPATNRVGPILYGLLNSDGIEESAMKQAIENAEKQAVRAARLMGKKAGSILNVSKMVVGPKLVPPELFQKVSGPPTLPTAYVSVLPNRVEVSVYLAVDFELISSNEHSPSLRER